MDGRFETLIKISDRADLQCDKDDLFIVFIRARHVIMQTSPAKRHMYEVYENYYTFIISVPTYFMVHTHMYLF